MNCRCGWDGTGDHPCHRCGKAPGTRRFRGSDAPFSLAGVQPKFSVVETYSCDECWKEWSELNQEITDEQIRALNRKHPEMLDTLMIALNSVDKELRMSARAEFAKLLKKDSAT